MELIRNCDDVGNVMIIIGYRKLTLQYRSTVGNPRDFTPQKFSVASAIIVI